MRYYRELDIDFSKIKEAILKDFDSETMGVFWNNINNNHLHILESIFKPYNLTPLSYVLINANPKTYVVHTDMSEADLRINIPILNCEHSSTHFFKPKTEEIKQRKLKELKERWDELDQQEINYPHTKKDSIVLNEIDKRVYKSQKSFQLKDSISSTQGKLKNAGADFMHYKHNEVVLVDQLRLVKPTILRIKEPHAVAVLKNATPRLSLTIDFKENLEHLLEYGL